MCFQFCFLCCSSCFKSGSSPFLPPCSFLGRVLFILLCCCSCWLFFCGFFVGMVVLETTARLLLSELFHVQGLNESTSSVQPAAILPPTFHPPPYCGAESVHCLSLRRTSSCRRSAISSGELEEASAARVLLEVPQKTLVPDSHLSGCLMSRLSSARWLSPPPLPPNRRPSSSLIC